MPGAPTTSFKVPLGVAMGNAIVGLTQASDAEADNRAIKLLRLHPSLVRDTFPSKRKSVIGYFTGNERSYSRRCDATFVVGCFPRVPKSAERTRRSRCCDRDIEVSVLRAVAVWLEVAVPAQFHA